MQSSIDEELTSSRILIVDAQEAIVRVIERILDGAGFRQHSHTTDFRQVLPLYSSFQPDLLLLDLQMPHQTGLEVMEQLGREIPAGGYLPILVLTVELSD